MPRKELPTAVVVAGLIAYGCFVLAWIGGIGTLLYLAIRWLWLNT